MLLSVRAKDDVANMHRFIFYSLPDRAYDI